jgi:hypothetical protein
MESNIMELRVVGRLTKDLINKYKDILEYFSNNNASEIILFCDFSEFEINKNYLFNNIRVNENIIACPLLLKSISQEYMLPFESIPIGWKTVCKFEILEADNIKLINSLPEINEWSESNTVFVLS